MGKLLSKPLAFERGDKLYLVSTVAPFVPGATELQEFAFAEQLKELAPNENILWLKGHYVESERANSNGHMWTEGELALKHLTPRLMPVTVMHDPRSAVGLIADAKLATPESDGIPRSRIDTSLAVWKHRFPEVANEVMANYEAGTLMQSMECITPNYSCSSCGKTYYKLPDNAEQDMWCDHLKGLGDTGEKAARILGNVTFTGTGLIFGTRGSRGAYDEAHLDVFQDEIAEFHSESHETPRKTNRPRRRPRMETIEISTTEYAELQKRPTPEALKAAEDKAEAAESAKTEAESKAEAAELKQKEAETAKAEADKKVADATEAAEKVTLSKERMSKLGEGFTAKLTDSIRERLSEQAKDMTDEAWASRLEELAELTGVKTDAGKPEGDPAEGDPEFKAEEVAAAGVGGEGGSKEPTAQARSGVFGGLFKAATGQETAKAE